jgi:hypothetical protein
MLQGEAPARGDKAADAAEVFPLYGDATNIAETSLTLPRIRVVIDAVWCVARPSIRSAA